MTEHAPSQPVPFVRRVRVRNYRSIANCDVTLGPLTVLLGFNASGKSNFLDTLRFVSQALSMSPTKAAEVRGGLETLLHRNRGQTADSFTIQLDLMLQVPDIEEPVAATYGFEIGRDPTGELPLLVLGEECEIAIPAGPVRLPSEPAGRSDRLRLPALAIGAEGPLAVLERALRGMRFYELDTSVLAEVNMASEQHRWLGPLGTHLGSVLGKLAGKDPIGKERLDAYLSALVPGALGVDERSEGRYSTVQARFRASDGEGVEVFLREELSEGTLRAAGVLTALLQPEVSAGRVPLVAIEEVEDSLHPAGLAALYEALDDAAERTQVIVTSQSPDLLESEYAQVEHIRVVANVDCATQIGRIDPGGRAIIEKGLMTLAELHRSGQMQPEVMPLQEGHDQR